MRSRSLLVLALLTACTPVAPTQPAVAPTAELERTEEAAHPHRLRIVVEAPAHVPYDPDALGIGGRSVNVRVTNAGAAPIRLRPLKVTFRASRNGVGFACREPVRHAVVEPAWLGPGQSYAFDEHLSCSLPLPGPYDVDVFLRAAEVDARDANEPVASFRVDVDGGARTPRPYPARDGLFVMMVGAKTTHPLPPEAWARGDYSVTLAIINGSKEALPVGPGKLAFLVYKQGSALPCSGQAESVQFPDRLMPGTMHAVRAPVACAPSDEGRYEIVGRLTLGDGNDAEVEVGRVALRVTRDPILLSPEPWPATSATPVDRLR